MRKQLSGGRSPFLTECEPVVSHVDPLTPPPRTPRQAAGEGWGGRVLSDHHQIGFEVLGDLCRSKRIEASQPIPACFNDFPRRAAFSLDGDGEARRVDQDEDGAH